MNTNLALGIQPLRIPDPAAPIQKALSLNAMLGQNEMQGLQIGQARQALARQSKLDAIKSQSRDLVTMKDRLMQEGFANEAIELDRHLRDQQKSQGDLTEQKLKMAAGMAGGFLALDPISRKANYPAFSAEWLANGLPGTPPPQWDESLTPNLMRWASYTLPAQNVQERLDYAALGQPSSMPATTMSERVTEVPTISGPKGLKLPYSESNLALLEQLPSDEAAFQERLASTGQAAAPEVGVDAKKVKTPEDLRAEGRYFESRGTKAGFERAKEKFAEADRLDKLALDAQVRDQAEQRLKFDKEKFASEQAKNEADKRAAQEKASYDKGEDYFKRSDKLRDDYTKASNPFIAIRDAYTRLKAATKTPSAAGDIALIFGYMRMLDPSSTVREGEFATAQNAAGVPDQVRNMWNKLLTGERLQDTQRADFIGQAEAIYTESKSNHDSLQKQFSGLAKRVNVDPQDVILDYGIKDSKPGQGPRKTGAGSGTQTDPFKIKGEDGWSAVPKGAFYTAPDGSLRQKR